MDDKLESLHSDHVPALVVLLCLHLQANDKKRPSENGFIRWKCRGIDQYFTGEPQVKVGDPANQVIQISFPTV